MLSSGKRAAWLIVPCDAKTAAWHVAEGVRWCPFLREPRWVVATRHLASEDPVAMHRNLRFARFQSPVPLAAPINTELAGLQVATQDIALYEPEAEALPYASSVSRRSVDRLGWSTEQTPVGLRS